ncbi:homoserine dehydrogenase [Aureibacillus halotolerans]|uniref:Homoserine dehydrogenase n=1 Tax=Aureibacillus halotolerans TaxID=1508390 RepID=A0A4V3D5K7_9BACI|nr:homoserine dehydrogenase [Aureibacillus halotolerans]TDQ40437.1 homoserine dehydrogenase [Aureibacillus halotolerans]
MKNHVSIGLLGLGTVGTGVAEIIYRHQDQLMHKVGCPIQIEKVLVKDGTKERGWPANDIVLTENPYDVLDDPELDLIVEVMGGVDETKEYLIRALENKKSVITANKDLMAVHGPELHEIARANGCDLYYEASVAGGIPILRSLSDGLASDRITKMMGIVNGTTNYILTKMIQDSRSFDDVLFEAQKLGYAEADPTSDVEGIDAARKMAILATLGFSMNVGLQDVDIKGISQVSGEDLAFSKKMGYVMKLIGIAERDGDEIEISVQPTLLPATHPLAAVNDEFNAVYVYGESVGETMFYGPGAGKLPTATAVVSDVIAVIKNMRLGVSGKTVVTPQYEKKLKSDESIRSKYFFRLRVKDEVGVFSKMTQLFAANNIGFERIMQLPLEDEPGIAEIVLITHSAQKSAYERIVNELNDLDVVFQINSSYRVEGE